MEREYYLRLSLVNGIGPKTFSLLLNYFKTAQKAWNSSSSELKKAGLGDKLIRKFEEQKTEINIKGYLEKLKSNKVSFIALCDKDYPRLLKEIENPPIVLYVKGNLSLVNFDKTIAIVGTRKITNYGREVTEIFSSDLSSAGITIVSGLAMGVDAQAAWSAINASGKTIAVLGSGVNLCFPMSNKNLYDKILDNNGIIISEFPLDQSPTPGSFPSRNRIIAGLSLGVLVTEGDKDSGSLITADYAFKFNRKVFAIPGPITSSLSVAPLRLIEKGAKLVASAEDIEKELKIGKNAIGKSKKLDRAGKMGQFSKEEIKIIKALENEPLHFDQIIRALSINASDSGIILSFLEVKGIVKSTNGGYYKLL